LRFLLKDFHGMKSRRTEFLPYLIVLQQKSGVINQFSCGVPQKAVFSMVDDLRLPAAVENNWDCAKLSSLDCR
jgi:hypothetical protein